MQVGQAAPVVVRTYATASPAVVLGRWLVAVIAMLGSTCVLDVTATATGTVLATSPLLDGMASTTLYAALFASYALWATGLRANSVANWTLLEHTGISTNVLSKAMFDLARRRSCGRRAQRMASAVGYVGSEIAKEMPYYAGAFGATVVSDGVSSTDALVFLVGTNLGAAVYEHGLAKLSRSVVAHRRSSHERADLSTATAGQREP